MLEPEKYYRISFYVEDYQFTENVELRVSVFREKKN